MSDTQAMAGKQRRLEIEKASKERAAARNGETGPREIASVKND